MKKMLATSMRLFQMMKRPQLGLAIGLSITILLVNAPGNAAYIKGRPIIITGGQIGQGYLWGETASGLGEHRGVDFPYVTGTHVYSIADGTVKDLAEGYPNNQGQGAWGNYVLIRHDQRHYDRVNHQWAYVYSMYLHLSQGSVRPTVGQHVSANEWIADVDNSGVHTSGAHLHLQVVVHTQANGELEPFDNLNTDLNSRNPELWITPYNQNTARVVGKITDSAGNPVANLKICGMNKPYGNFEWAQTYSFGWMKADDILVENFATTDVSAGTRHLYARQLAGDCTASLYRDLGDYTFYAGKTTYVGLYPTYLPFLREDSNWHSTIYVRNNSAAKTAQVDTTFFRYDGLVSAGNSRTDILAPNDIVSFWAPSNFRGSATIVGSEDIVVTAQVQYCSSTWTCEPSGYNALTPDTGVGTVGWEKAGTIIFAPLVKNQYSGRTSEIYITNAGTDLASFSIRYYDSNGNEHYGGDYNGWDINSTGWFRPSDFGLPTGQYYSAKIQSNNGQPLAVVVLEGDGSGPDARPAVYNGFSSGANGLYAPMVKKEYPYTGGPSQSTTGITVQNTTGVAANVTGYYYNMDGGLVATISSTVQPYSPWVVWNPAQIPNDFLGSVRFSSSQPIVGQMSESNITIGGGRRMMSSLSLSGAAATRRLVLPAWYHHYTTSDWLCGVNVRHAGASGSSLVAATWYNNNGNYVCSATQSLINQHDTLNFYDVSCAPALGSLVLQASAQNVVAVESCRDGSQASVKERDSVFTTNVSNR